MCRLRILALLVVCSVPSAAGSTCRLPVDLQGSTWDYSSPYYSFPVQFGNSSISAFSLIAFGTPLSTYDCISNMDNIYVFRSRSAYSYHGNYRYVFLCVRLTQVSSNTFYFYLLSDIDTSQIVYPPVRIFNPPYDKIPPDTDPTCNFCSFTTAPEDYDFHILRRPGTFENVLTPKPCLPCGKTQAVCDNPCACTAQEIDNSYARRQFEWIATVRNGDDFIPKNPPAGYKFAVIKVISTCLGETPYDNLARLNTVDPATIGSMCPNAFAHLQVGETYVFFGTIKVIEGRRTFVVDQCTPPAKTTYQTCPRG